MNKSILNLLIIMGVIGLVVCVAIIRSKQQEPVEEAPPVPTNVPTNYLSTTAPMTITLPRLVEIGGETCIPCMQMAPILDELKKEYTGRVEIEKIDLAKTPSAQKIYAIRLIPTQVFLKSDGQEYWRNEGTLTKAEIVTKFVEMGVK
jgi:thioredoxin 1